MPRINYCPADSVVCFQLLTLIHWIAIYPMDNVIQSSNNWGIALFSLQIISPKLDPIGKNSNFYHLNLKDIPNSEMNIKTESSYLATILECQLSTVIK